MINLYRYYYTLYQVNETKYQNNVLIIFNNKYHKMMKLLHYSPYIAGIALVIQFLITKSKSRQLDLINLGIIQFLNILVSASCKLIIQLPRPSSEERGFPSAHSMFWSGYIIVMYFQQQRIAAYVFMLLLVSLERYIDGYHYLYQIVGGILFGALFSYFAVNFVIIQKLAKILQYQYERIISIINH
uniref:PAP2 superfamily protein n=1 Tax=Spironucleus salmonicida TaxID=348837 RepID=V6LL75_9EUKA|eukprot:EST45118.1 PAP2 superfamily protein [Spironucleus salmonicida]